jgi:histone-lysine N-methyltransferase SETMAR
LKKKRFSKFLKMEKSIYRSYILVRHKLGLTPTEIFDELRLCYPDSYPSYMTVWRWWTRFDEGNLNLEDNDRPGRPITAVTITNIKLVSELIEFDCHITYEQIEEELSLSPPSIYEIIHVHLKLRKISSRWVPYELTSAQKQKRVDTCQYILDKIEAGLWRICDILTGDESWIYERIIGRKQSNMAWVAYGTKPPTQVKRYRFDTKWMISVFFKSTGVVHIYVLPQGKTVTAQYYRDNCLKKVVEKVMEERPTSGLKNMKILHDNAKPHVALIVKKYLQEQNLTIIDHPPYSPDLAPSDFWLFDYLKQRLDSHSDVESLKSQITEVLLSLPREEYLKTFKKWVERMKLCIDNRGEYFEHLKK